MVCKRNLSSVNNNVGPVSSLDKGTSLDTGTHQGVFYPSPTQYPLLQTSIKGTIKTLLTYSYITWPPTSHFNATYIITIYATHGFFNCEAIPREELNLVIAEANIPVKGNCIRAVAGEIICQASRPASGDVGHNCVRSVMYRKVMVQFDVCQFQLLSTCLSQQDSSIFINDDKARSTSSRWVATMRPPCLRCRTSSTSTRRPRRTQSSALGCLQSPRKSGQVWISHTTVQQHPAREEVPGLVRDARLHHSHGSHPGAVFLHLWRRKSSAQYHPMTTCVSGPGSSHCSRYQPVARGRGSVPLE